MSDVNKKRNRDDLEEIVEAVEEKKKSKKDKKDKKKHRKEESEDVEEPVEVAVVEEEAEEASEKSEKKKSKKKKDKKESRDREEAVDEPKQSTSSSSSSRSSNESNLYKEHSSTRAMSNDEVNSIRSELAIQVYPKEEGDAYKPMTSFSCLNPSLDGVCPFIQQYITEKNFSKPTPIQSQCWGPLLAGRDVIGIAATGSGKTLTFLIPVMLKLAKLRAINGAFVKSKGLPKPKVLILAPTRELAMQSQKVVEEIKGGPKGVCIYGGVPKGQQRAELSAGAEIVVATPGRLLDLIEENAFSLSEICYLVLDEADRMLDDGFEPAIRAILSKCPAAGPGLADRQTVMFSATWPEEIRALADKFLRSDVVRVVVGSEDLSANHRVTQIVECVEAHEKDKKLIALLDKYHKSRKNRVLVFVLYKKEAADLQNKLLARGFNAQSIHGDKSQYDRTAALDEFKTGKTPLLIATDVAARGLDIPQVEYVLNYSFPLTVEDYVHRIGRTGRGGATGVSHTFFTDFDKGLAGALVGVLQEAKQEVPQEIFKYQMVTKKKTSKLYGDFGPKTELSGMKSTKITFD